MAIERDFELLDDYLANRMPEKERIAFEQQAEKDVELRNELRIQQSLIEGLKKARVMELKSMLNNIPVPPPVSTPFAIATKFIIGGVVTVIVGTGLYFLLADNKPSAKETVVVDTLASSDKEVTETITPAIVEEKQPTEITEPAKKNEVSEQSTPKAKNIKPAENKSSSKSLKEDEAVDPKIEVFDPNAEPEENSEEVDQELVSDDSRVSPANSTLIVEVDSNSRKYNFHYKIENDKLVLYGPFEKNLYEILEFISEEKRTAFLYYKQSYYTIKSADKIQPLEPIRDPVLLKKLREHRSIK